MSIDPALVLTPFEEVLARFKAGEMVVMVDRLDRENEGDLVIATAAATPQAIAFMMREGRGLVCVSISEQLAHRLNLPMQTAQNNSPYQTPFAVSVDHRTVSNFGVTATARAETMKRLINPASCPEDFISPGHVFPLVANVAGVLGRQGQTEGSYDLARLAGFLPSGIICEILNPDGSVAKGRQVVEFAKQHGLAITSVDQIIEHRLTKEVLVRQVASSNLESDFGPCRSFVYVDDTDGKEHLVAVFGDPEIDSEHDGALVRIHSECLTGDVFGSRRCDCGPQLDSAAKTIAAHGSGIVIYLRQEGRGIGLLNKLRAYELQDQGHDTVEANVKLGFAPDERDFAVAARILGSLNIRKVRLLTNNPNKIETLHHFGIQVVDRISLIMPPDEFSRKYLATKREKLGHLLPS